MAGFSVFALVAFTVAFALAAQGGRCGPGCDALGTAFSPAPTVAPASSNAPTTTGPKRPTTTTVAKAPAGHQRPPGRLRRPAGHDHHRPAGDHHHPQAQPDHPAADDPAADHPDHRATDDPDDGSHPPRHRRRPPRAPDRRWIGGSRQGAAFVASYAVLTRAGTTNEALRACVEAA